MFQCVRSCSSGPSEALLSPIASLLGVATAMIWHEVHSPALRVSSHRFEISIKMEYYLVV